MSNNDITQYVHKDQDKSNDKVISLEAAQELIVAVMERQVKRLFILCLVIFITLFVALVASNAAWLYYENQFEDVTTSVTQETSADGGGSAVINGENAGAVFYGEGKTDSNN